MKNNLRISIFCSLIGIFTAGAYKLLRFGLSENADSDIIKVIGLLLFFLFTPILTNEMAGEKKSKLVYHPVSVLILCLAVLTVIGFFLEFYPTTKLGWFFSIIGILLFVRHLFLFVAKSTWIDYVIGLPATLMAGVINCGYIYSNYAKPHLFESLATQHIPYNFSTDTLFHSAIAQMIRTYGVVSTGLDGAPFINYHFGSHAIFGALSNVLDFNLLKFYILACPTLFSPIFYFTFFYFVIQVSKFIKPEKNVLLNYFFWMMFFGIFFGFLKRGFIWHNGLQLIVPGVAANSAILVSESYMLSVLLTFALFTLVLVELKEEIPVAGKYLFYVFLFPLLIFLIGITKISTGFVILFVVGYIFIRCSLYREKTYIFSFILSVVCWGLSYSLTRETNSSEGVLNFEFFNNKISYIVGFIALHFFWSYLLILLYIFRKIIDISFITTAHGKRRLSIKRNPISSIKHAIKSRKTILVEIVMVVSIVGFVPKAILSLGPNGVFFSEIQFFISAGVLLGSILSFNFSSFKIEIAPALRHMVIIVSFFGFSYINYANAQHFMREMVDSNFAFRKTVVGDYADTKPRLALTKQLRRGSLSSVDSILNVYGKPVQDSLNNKKEYIFLKRLAALDQLPHNEKKETMVYINHKTSSFVWGIPCQDIAFMVPALSGIVQLDGMIVKEQCSFTGYAMDYYNEKSSADYEQQYSEVELCTLAKEKGFNHLIIYREKSNAFIKLSCRK